jgi:hypothetical protein
MPSLDPPSPVSKFVYIIRRIYLDAEDVGNGCNLIHSKLIIACHHISETGAHMIDLTVVKHPFSVSMRLC